jgi:glycosyltransferase involved in cell wall biosynthesis
MVEAVDEILVNPEEWSARGIERAAAFSWDKTARAHEAVYSELAR